MSQKEIEDFVKKSIEQIKSGLPQDCGLAGNFDFEISVVTTKGAKGGINISLVEAGLKSNLQQIHKIRFSIVDKKSQKENTQQAMQTLRKFFNELKQLDSKQSKKRKK